MKNPRITLATLIALVAATALVGVAVEGYAQDSGQP